MTEQQPAPHVYTLTALTRQSAQERRMVIFRADVPRRGVVIVVMSLVVSLLPTLILWQLVDVWALLVPAIAVLAAFWLIERRTPDGLHLRTYQAMYDKRVTTPGRFICCGVEVKPRPSGYGYIVQAAMPSPFRRPETSAADLFTAAVPLPRWAAGGPAVPAAGGQPVEDPPLVRPRLRRRSRREAEPFAVAADNH